MSATGKLTIRYGFDREPTMVGGETDERYERNMRNNTEKKLKKNN
jgi:hypothetical protein